MNIDDYISRQSAKIEKSIYSSLPEQPEWIYGMLREYISRGGKRIRPILALASADALGGKEEDVLPYAIAIEIFHNFTLIHDDIEDNSPIRRGKPTLHEQFGIPVAINSGDALYTVVWSTLLKTKIPPEKFHGAMKLMVNAFSDVVNGQGTELEWYRTGRVDVSEKEYFRMAGGKTGSLIGVSCRMGAYAAGAPQETQEAMQAFGEKIGLSFQIRDDVLNLIADPSKYKKEIGEDIKEGKRSLITLNLLGKLPEPQKSQVEEILKKPDKTEEEVQKIISLSREHGSIDYAGSVSDKLVGEAKQALNVVEDEQKREILLSLADYMVRREK
jgi:geranylgeranyl diphosphate synthase, type I